MRFPFAEPTLVTSLRPTISISGGSQRRPLLLDHFNENETLFGCSETAAQDVVESVEVLSPFLTRDDLTAELLKKPLKV
jgi:hypothetical protein